MKSFRPQQGLIIMNDLYHTEDTNKARIYSFRPQQGLIIMNPYL